MNNDEKQEESYNAYNNWLDQQRYRRQDEQWRQKRLDEDRRQANSYLRQGDGYLSTLQRAGPAAAEAYAQRMREFEQERAAIVRTIYDGAVKAFNADDYQSALIGFNNCVSYEPNNPDIYSFRGTCYQQLQRYGEAEQDFSTAIDLTSRTGRQHVYYYLRRGECRLELGEVDAALHDFNLSESLLPKDAWLAEDPSLRAGACADLLYGRGRVQFYRGNYTAAKENFGACIQTFPNWDEPYIWRARVECKLQDPEGAIRDYSAVLNRNPTAAIYRERAWAYSSIEDYAAAAEDLDKVIQFDPLPEDYSDRGWKYLLMGGGRDDKALADFDDAIALGDHSSHTFYGRGLVQQGRNNISQALEDFDATINIDPANSFAYKNRGRIRYDQGEFELALADQEESVRIDPSNPNTLVELGNTYLTLGRNDSAKHTFLKAAELFREQQQLEKAAEVSARAIQI
jgi:tetratricopeptide (TPR) repeat protein